MEVHEWITSVSAEIKNREAFMQECLRRVEELSQLELLCNLSALVQCVHPNPKGYGEQQNLLLAIASFRDSSNGGLPWTQTEYLIRKMKPEPFPVVTAWAAALEFACSARQMEAREHVVRFYQEAKRCIARLQLDYSTNAVVRGFLDEEGALWLARDKAKGAFENWTASAEIRLSRYELLETDPSVHRLTVAGSAATLVRMFEETEKVFPGHRTDEFPVDRDFVESAKDSFGDTPFPILQA